jgi:hypothetical protein
MLASDFLAESPGVHALLYRLFASEVGIFEVFHPSVQFEALVHATADLKKQALAALDAGALVQMVMPDGSVTSISVSGRAEAHLFMELYRELDLFTGGVAFADSYSQSVTLAQVVYPKAARAIESVPALADAVLLQLAHVASHGPAVRERIAKDLVSKFRFSKEFCEQFAQCKLPA